MPACEICGAIRASVCSVAAGLGRSDVELLRGRCSQLTDEEPEAWADIVEPLRPTMAHLSSRRAPERVLCRACPHPRHLGICTGRSGGTGYRCGCSLSTP